MKKRNKNIIILYTVSIIALVLAIIALALVMVSGSNLLQPEPEGDWKCEIVECTEFIEISGEQWAQENCAITPQGTICTGILEDGTTFQRSLEEILSQINLSDLSATRCLSYVCTQEIKFRPANYEIELSQ